MHVVAIDWSGRGRGAEKFIWIAEVHDGRLVMLENGRSREAAIAWLQDAAAADPELIVGLDFAFSFPAWYLRERGWDSAGELWWAIAEEGESLLDAQPDPFWGRGGKRRPAVLTPERRLRAAEADLAAKSVFQIGGAGAVGTGSIRGMPHLLTLRAAGFSIWPFAETGAGLASGLPAACEIYPRALYPEPVVKRDPHARRQLLDAHFPDELGALHGRAASSEDAFDAAVSALVMSRSPPEPARRDLDPLTRLEGRIWTPSPAGGAR